MPLRYTARNLGSETAFSVTGGDWSADVVAAVRLYHNVDSYQYSTCSQAATMSLEGGPDSESIFRDIGGTCSCRRA